MQLNAVLDKSITQAAAVVRGASSARLDASTPCTEWDVRTLTNHLLQVAQALLLAGQGEPVPDESWGRDLMGGGWADRFDETGRAAAKAWAEPSAWEGMVSMGQARLPAPMIATMLASDLAIHAWDLARATGQDYHVDAGVAEAANRFLTEMGEQGRQMGIFAAPTAVADDTPAFERALALSGRDPRWTRPTA